MRMKLKLITGRNNGMGYERRKEVMHQTIRGWVQYFKLADAKKSLETMYSWLRRRIRMCIWRSWKKPSTRVKNLVKCGIPQWRAYMEGNSSKGYWANAGGIMQKAASNENLRRAGYPCLMDYYAKLHLQ